jgi:hypothetical protein
MKNEDLERILYNQPSFLIRADQWSEDSYVYWENRVYTYEIDRKEQRNMAFGSFAIEEFLASPEVSAEAKEWLRSLMR